MSDFDKEAEREKLREKYGKEDEKRKATEQMSELLLKGATMTNAHCTDCGDPIFRYDGQEFCPTCQKPVAREQGSGDEGTGTQGNHIEVADPSDDATVQFGDGQDGADGRDTTGTADDAPATGADANAADATDTATDAAEHPPAADRQTGDTTRETPSADPGRSPGAKAPAADSPSTPATSQPAPSAPERSEPARGSMEREFTDDSVTAELSAAESLLAETVHRFARRAADTDDPRTAREHLETAREAGEALDAVRF